MEQECKMKINFLVLFLIGFFGMFGLYYGIILDTFQSEQSMLPIRISSEDFVNGIHFTDLNAIDEVSKESIIVVSGILEYGE